MAKRSTKTKATPGKTTKRGRRPSTAAAAVRICADLSRYKIGEAETASGRRSLDIGDATAELLRGKSLDEVYELAAKTLGEDEKELRDRYKNLNVGMQRMNLGNRLRRLGK